VGKVVSVPAWPGVDGQVKCNEKGGGCLGGNGAAWDFDYCIFAVLLSEKYHGIKNLDLLIGSASVQPVARCLRCEWAIFIGEIFYDPCFRIALCFV
jgi:hypothetical protein